MTYQDYLNHEHDVLEENALLALRDDIQDPYGSTMNFVTWCHEGLRIYDEARYGTLEDRA